LSSGTLVKELSVWDRVSCLKVAIVLTEFINLRTKASEIGFVLGNALRQDVFDVSPETGQTFICSNCILVASNLFVIMPVILANCMKDLAA
jgi:hypothetical protein